MIAAMASGAFGLADMPSRPVLRGSAGELAIRVAVVGPGRRPTELLTPRLDRADVIDRTLRSTGRLTWFACRPCAVRSSRPVSIALSSTFHRLPALTSSGQFRGHAARAGQLPAIPGSDRSGAPPAGPVPQHKCRAGGGAVGIMHTGSEAAWVG